MNLRAISSAILIACALAGALVVLALVFDVSRLTAPQTLTLFAIWTLPGYYAGVRARDAGALHGLLSGLLGMPLISLAMELAADLIVGPLSAVMEGRSVMILVLLASFWAALGGMSADAVRLIRAKRAARKAGRAPVEPRR